MPGCLLLILVSQAKVKVTDIKSTVYAPSVFKKMFNYNMYNCEDSQVLEGDFPLNEDAPCPYCLWVHVCEFHTALCGKRRRV